MKTETKYVIKVNYTNYMGTHGEKVEKIEDAQFYSNDFKPRKNMESFKNLWFHDDVFEIVPVKVTTIYEIES